MTPAHGTAAQPQQKVIRIDFAINHPDEEIEKYQGQFVAWSMDGRKVLASGKTPIKCGEDVARKRLHADEYVLSYIDGPTSPSLG